LFILKERINKRETKIRKRVGVRNGLTQSLLIFFLLKIQEQDEEQTDEHEEPEDWKFYTLRIYGPKCTKFPHDSHKTHHGRWTLLFYEFRTEI